MNTKSPSSNRSMKTFSQSNWTYFRNFYNSSLPPTYFEMNKLIWNNRMKWHRLRTNKTHRQAIDWSILMKYQKCRLWLNNRFDQPSILTLIDLIGLLHHTSCWNTAAFLCVSVWLSTKPMNFNHKMSEENFLDIPRTPNSTNYHLYRFLAACFIFGILFVRCWASGESARERRSIIKSVPKYTQRCSTVTCLSSSSSSSCSNTILIVNVNGKTSEQANMNQENIRWLELKSARCPNHKLSLFHHILVY